MFARACRPLLVQLVSRPNVHVWGVLGLVQCRASGCTRHPTQRMYTSGDATGSVCALVKCSTRPNAHAWEWA